jgi:hypothetical protein
MIVTNPYSIPYESSLLNEDGSYRIFDFVADEKTRCFLVGSDATRILIDNQKALRFIDNRTRTIAINPGSFTYSWSMLFTFGVAVSAVIAPTCFFLHRYYHSKK